MNDDKLLDAARARVKLLEQTVSELRAQLYARAAVEKGAREASDTRGARRHSMRAPAARAESDGALAELRAVIDARQHDIETLSRERDVALAEAKKRESATESLRGERDDVRTKLEAAERERDEARAVTASLQALMATERATRPKASMRPPKHTTAEMEAPKIRSQALERQLVALRAEWKTADDRAKSLEAKLRQSRNVSAIAVVRAAADRASELTRLLEEAADKLGANDSPSGG